MHKPIIGAIPLIISTIISAEPVIYTDETRFLSDLAALGYSAIHESFEDSTVWADSRNSITAPGSTASVVSQGVVWTSNYAVNEIATGDVGGSAPNGTYAIYSLPHGLTTDSGLYCDSAEEPDIPVECYQNDGLTIESESGETLYAFGGRIDTSNSGKVTFLLDGTDINGNTTDNIDNWQREGDFADNWMFVGVIDTDGFQSVELRELRGKDTQQVLLFSDDFSIGVNRAPQILAGSIEGIILNYTFCKDLGSGVSTLDAVFSSTANWNCSETGFTLGNGNAAIAVMSGTRTLATTPVNGSVSGISPIAAICTNVTTSTQVVGLLGGSNAWNCDIAGLVSSPGDQVRVILYGTAL